MGKARGGGSDASGVTLHLSIEESGHLHVVQPLHDRHCQVYGGITVLGTVLPEGDALNHDCYGKHRHVRNVAEFHRKSTKWTSTG